MDGCGCVQKVRLDMSAKIALHVCSTISIPLELLYQDPHAPHHHHHLQPRPVRNLKWLLPAPNAAEALAASVEESWLYVYEIWGGIMYQNSGTLFRHLFHLRRGWTRTNVLWGCLVIVWIFGWMAMNGSRKRFMYLLLGTGVGVSLLVPREGMEEKVFRESVVLNVSQSYYEAFAQTERRP